MRRIERIVVIEDKSISWIKYCYHARLYDERIRSTRAASHVQIAAKEPASLPTSCVVDLKFPLRERACKRDDERSGGDRHSREISIDPQRPRRVSSLTISRFSNEPYVSRTARRFFSHRTWASRLATYRLVVIEFTAATSFCPTSSGIGYFLLSWRNWQSRRSLFLFILNLVLDLSKPCTRGALAASASTISPDCRRYGTRLANTFLPDRSALRLSVCRVRPIELLRQNRYRFRESR